MTAARTTLAFYHGRGARRWHRVQDAAIRFYTKSRYSHVELIAGRAEYGQLATCLSSSGRDGGVREKRIRLDRSQWELVTLSIDPERPERFIRDRIGAGYDYRGILLSQLIPGRRHNPDKWFCSEICAEAIGLAQGWRYSPGRLCQTARCLGFVAQVVRE